MSGDSPVKITDRLDLNIGHFCNQRCLFCYYQNETAGTNYSLRDIKKRLLTYKRYGIKKLHITGGEPLLHKNIREIIVYARDSGFSHISIITNGVLLSESRLEDLRLAGVDEFVISLHGAQAVTHNNLVDGDFFTRSIDAIKILHNRNFPFSINFVVTAQNYAEMDKFSSLAVLYRPRLVTFLYFNPERCCTEGNFSLLPDYAGAQSHMNTAGRILDADGVPWDFKFVPVCFSPENITHCNNSPQAIYDFEEWNYKVRLLLSPLGFLKYYFSLLRWYRNFAKAQLEGIPYAILSYWCALMYGCRRSFSHTEGCHACSNRYGCLGVHKDYLKKFGPGIVCPQKGEDVLYFFRTRSNIALKADTLDKVINYILYYLSHFFPPWQTL